MEIKKRILILLIMVLFVPIKALAGSVRVDLDCPASANKNSEVICKVSAISENSDLTGIQFNYDLKGVTYKEFVVDNNWTTYSNNINGVSLGRNETKEKVVVGSLKATMGTTDATLSLIKIQGTNKNYETLNGDSISKKITIKSDDNYLQSLSIDEVDLNPKFNSEVTNYTASCEQEKIKINATANSNAAINGIGTFNLKYGTNTFNVDVTSESGVKKTYTISVTRKDKRNTNNDLKKLSVDKGTLKFNKNATSYSLSVEQEIDKIKIDAELEDDKASFVNKFGPRSVDLKYGNNKIEIKVQAENEKIKVYTINVTRKDDRSDNANLKGLTVNPGTIVFDPNQDIYEFSVKSDVNKIEIVPILDDENAKVEIDNKELEEGLNTIKITVISEKGNSKVYTLNVTKLKPGEGLSDNNNIKKLEILNYDVDFDINNNSYIIKINDEKELFFNIEMEDENASYEIQNNSDLINGSIVKIIVKSESGEVKEYNFLIEKEEKSVSKNNILTYIIILILSVLLGMIIIIKRKKNKKKVLIPEEII